MDYAILVNSCDAYKDIWPFFFFLLRKNWNDQNIPAVYLNTETEKYSSDDIDVNVINCGDKAMPWGRRLISALRSINTDYVLMMLEDFYYESPIRVDVINECVEKMKKDDRILSFQLVPASEVYRKEVKPENHCKSGFALRERKATYTFIAGPTLWRKSDLIALVRKSDSPWDFEWYGSLRTQLYGKKIYCWESFDEPIFDYDLAHGGAVHGGKWVGYKMKELEEKYHYKLEYGDREIVDDWLKEEKSERKTEHYRKKQNKIQKLVIPRLRNAEYQIKRNKNILYGLCIHIRMIVDKICSSRLN